MLKRRLIKSALPFFLIQIPFLFSLYIEGHTLEAVLYAYFSLLFYLLYVSASLTRGDWEELMFLWWSVMLLYYFFRTVLEPILILLWLALYLIYLGFLTPLKALMLRRGFAVLAFLLGVVGAVDWLLFGPSRLLAVNAAYALLLYACGSAKLSYAASLLPIPVHLLAPRGDVVLEAAALSLPYWAIAALQLARRRPHVSQPPTTRA